ncbi:MAG: Flp family type IVb pilin [Hamadaea sp.]|uniref:Flp family type IVb pilin n=1 Tax=Hamadaea sp. TaxID=2024425 RepID=UPI001855647E|nr:Flp family type IVb pilin [Hamadaea sp.]NUR71218.1 Flp family type IVb pilin [Hamadaea sp.]NUT17749.1 Flp family type IVb pilin [Hamadaea sp.]
MKTEFLVKPGRARYANRRRPADQGATAVEYALFLALIASVITGAVLALGQTVAGFFTTGAGLFP